MIATSSLLSVANAVIASVLLVCLLLVRCGIEGFTAQPVCMQVRVVRIFNTYGPRMALDDGRVVSNFVAQALTDQDLTVYGDGQQTRSFQYVSDLIKGKPTSTSCLSAMRCCTGPAMRSQIIAAVIRNSLLHLLMCMLTKFISCLVYQEFCLLIKFNFGSANIIRGCKNHQACVG